MIPAMLLPLLTVYVTPLLNAIVEAGSIQGHVLLDLESAVLVRISYFHFMYLTKYLPNYKLSLK